MDHSKSQAAFAEAKQYIPGGVNSPVRSFRSVGGVPPVIAKGSGSKLTDIDGNRIDPATLDVVINRYEDNFI